MRRQPFTYRSPVIVNSLIVLEHHLHINIEHLSKWRFGGGCFEPGTMMVIRWKSCTDRTLYVRSIVMTWNENTKMLEPKTNISHHATKNMPYIFDVELSDGRILQVTDSHPFMLTNGEWGAFDVEKCVREHDGWRV